MIAELHVDGAERIGAEKRQAHADLNSRLAESIAAPSYAVVNPRDGTVMNNWGWENADAKKWKKLLTETIDRWQSLKQN